VDAMLIYIHNMERNAEGEVWMNVDVYERTGHRRIAKMLKVRAFVTERLGDLISQTDERRESLIPKEVRAEYLLRCPRGQ